MTTSPPRPRLDAVAAMASVSLATASKVLNGHSDVAAKTRERVEEAISTLGYQSPSARRSQQRRTVEFMVDKLASPYAMEVLRGVTLAAEEHDIDVVVGRFRQQGDSEKPPVVWIQRLVAAQRMGAVVVTAEVDPSRYRSITESRLPVVVIDPLQVTNPDLVSVASTNWIGGRTAAEHLIGLGHTRLAIVGGPAQSISAAARVDGFRSACAEAGIEVDPRRVRQVVFDHDAARKVAETWFRSGDRPTGIIASSDAQAMGVLEAARVHGIQVPAELSLVGYDDTYIASWSNPPLTCVRQPLHDIGRVALRTLVQLDRRERPDSNHIELATTFVVRGSTAPPPTRTTTGANA